MPVHLEECLDWWGIEPLETEPEPQVYRGQQGALSDEQFKMLTALLQTLWKEGQRNEMAMGVTGLLAKEGYAQAEAARVIDAVCRATADTQRDDRLAVVKRTYDRARGGLSVVGWKAFADKVDPDTASYLSGLLKLPEEVICDFDGDPYSDIFELTEPQDFPSSEALIDSILPSDPRGQVVYLSGLSQSFKSYLALDFACHIALGIPWHGHETSQGQTLYVVGEGTYEYIFSRLRAWEAHHGTRVPGIKCRLSPIPLMNRDAVLSIIDRYTKKLGDEKPRLVILDTLSQCAGSADENSSKDARTIYQNAKEFGKAWGSTVLIVCHRGKSDSNIMRGSSALFDDSDGVIEMVRPGWQSGGLSATLNVKKIKTGRLIIGHELTARVVPWRDAEKEGSDLVLVQTLLRSVFDEAIAKGGLP